MNAGRLERLEESTRKPQRHAVLLPGFLAYPRHETQRPRAGARGTVEPGQQQARSLVVAHELAAVHVAVTDAMLQRDAPLPTGFARRRTRVGSGGGEPFAGHRHGAVTRQPLAPVMVSGVQGLLDEQSAEPRAVHEEVASDLAAVGELQRLDVAVFAALLHFDDATFVFASRRWLLPSCADTLAYSPASK